MHNKNILITGAAGGIGQCIALHFSKPGYNLALHWHTTKIDLSHFDSSGIIKAYKADLTKQDDVLSMHQSIIAEIGDIHILINCASISDSGMSWKISLTEWQKVIDTNLTSVFLMTSACIPSMRANEWGRIINITSEGGLTGLVGGSAYSASKSALEGLCKSLAKELANKNITVNNVSPGYMNTGMVLKLPEDIRKQVEKDIPLNRLGNPTEIAFLIEHLVSENASYITGQTFKINGGIS